MDSAELAGCRTAEKNMDYVKHPTLPPALLHGQTMLERKSPSASRQTGRLFVSDKRPDGSFVLKFRPELALCSQDVVRRPTTEAQPDPESGGIVPPEGRLLCQNEVDGIRANTDGERQLTGCAFTLDLVRARLTPRVTAGPRPGGERSSFRRPPKR